MAEEKRFRVKVQGFRVSIWLIAEKDRLVAKVGCPKPWCSAIFTSTYKDGRGAARSRSLVKQHLGAHIKQCHPKGSEKYLIGTESAMLRRRLVKIKLYQQRGGLLGGEAECPVGKCREAFSIYGRPSEKNVQVAISKRLDSHLKLHPL